MEIQNIEIIVKKRPTGAEDDNMLFSYFVHQIEFPEVVRYIKANVGDIICTNVSGVEITHFMGVDTTGAATLKEVRK